VREDRNGRTFVDLEIADQSGSMAAKIWADSAALNSEFEAHDFVAFRGGVKLYREQLQISIDECRRATDDDRRHGFDEALLIPSSHRDVDEMLGRLEAVLAEHVERPALQRLARETLEVHGEALRVHPAAKSMHHAYRGGLLEHVLSMAELAVAVATHYGDLDRDLLLVGVLFHDLGKLAELGAMPVNDYTLEGRLVGHVVIGRDLLRERCAAIPGFPDDLRLLLEHLVLSHQGKKEFASPVEPMTPEALALHYIDDLDSKLNQFARSREAGGGVLWHRGLGRHIYLSPALDGEEGPDQGESDDGDADDEPAGARPAAPPAAPEEDRAAAARLPPAAPGDTVAEPGRAAKPEPADGAASRAAEGEPAPADAESAAAESAEPEAAGWPPGPPTLFDHR
jgi:3'-5' exoribonuclease